MNLRVGLAKCYISVTLFLLCWNTSKR